MVSTRPIHITTLYRYCEYTSNNPDKIAVMYFDQLECTSTMDRGGGARVTDRYSLYSRRKPKLHCRRSYSRARCKRPPSRNCSGCSARLYSTDSELTRRTGRSFEHSEIPNVRAKENCLRSGSRAWFLRCGKQWSKEFEQLLELYGSM